MAWFKSLRSSALLILFASVSTLGMWQPIGEYNGRFKEAVNESAKGQGTLKFRMGDSEISCGQQVFTNGVINTNYHCCHAGRGAQITAVFDAGTPGKSPASVSCRPVAGGENSRLDTCLLQCPGLQKHITSGKVKPVNLLTRRPKANELVYNTTNNCRGGTDCQKSRKVSMGRVGRESQTRARVSMDENRYITVDEIIPTSAYSCQGSSGSPFFTADNKADEGGMIGLLNSGDGEGKRACGNANFIPSSRIAAWLKAKHPSIFNDMNIDGSKSRLQEPVAPAAPIQVAEVPPPPLRVPASVPCAPATPAAGNAEDLRQIAVAVESQSEADRYANEGITI